MTLAGALLLAGYALLHVVFAFRRAPFGVYAFGLIVLIALSLLLLS